MEGLALFKEPTALVDGDETMVQIVEMMEIVPQTNGKKRILGTAHTAQKVLDTETNVTYQSLAKCGKALCGLVGTVEKDNFAWYKLAKQFPTRFIRFNGN